MKNVFFDFDGTLAETSRGIVNGYNYAFEKKGLPKVPEKRIRENIGPPLTDVLRNLAPDESEEDIVRLAELYREYFSSEGIYELEFFEGVRDLLDRLAGADVRLCILSSKPAPFIERILERYDYGKYFSVIDGVSLGYDNKPKKERLSDRILSDRLDPSECIVVGDRAEDMNAARHCGTAFVGVLFGYGSEEELAGAETVRSVRELGDSLFSWIGG